VDDAAVAGVQEVAVVDVLHAPDEPGIDVMVCKTVFLKQTVATKWPLRRVFF
jgi:hypothetical protein